MDELHIDMETESEIDLKKCGISVYARHPSTKVLCMAWAFNDEEPQLWKPPESFPEKIIEHINNGGKVFAHNSDFELYVWNYCLRRQLSDSSS